MKDFKKYLFYVCKCFVCVHMHVLCLWLAEEGIESVRTGVTDGWKPHKCWESLTEVLCDQLVL